MHRLNSLRKQGENSDAQVLRTRFKMISGPYAFFMLSQREKNSLDKITMVSINALYVDGRRLNKDQLMILLKWNQKQKYEQKVQVQQKVGESLDDGKRNNQSLS